VRWVVLVSLLLLAGCASQPSYRQKWADANSGGFGQDRDGLRSYFSDDGYGNSSFFMWPDGSAAKDEWGYIGSGVRWRKSDPELWQEVAAIVEQYGGQDIKDGESCHNLGMSHGSSHSLYVRSNSKTAYYVSNSSSNCSHTKSDEAGRRIIKLIANLDWSCSFIKGERPPLCIYEKQGD